MHLVLLQVVRTLTVCYLITPIVSLSAAASRDHGLTAAACAALAGQTAVSQGLLCTAANLTCHLQKLLSLRPVYTTKLLSATVG